MSRLTTVTVGPLAAASANSVALSQTVAGAANVVLNGALVVGGVAKLDLPRRIIVTSAGNDSGITFTAYGTDWSGNPIQSKATAGGNIAAVDLGVSFATVTRIATSGATAAAITVGTNGVADSRPIFLDEFGFAACALQVSVVGTVNYTVQQSMDDPNGTGGFGVPLGLQNVNWLNSADAALNAATVTVQSNYAYAPKITRVTLNSGTGSITFTVSQLASPVK